YRILAISARAAALAAQVELILDQERAASNEVEKPSTAGGARDKEREQHFQDHQSRLREHLQKILEEIEACVRSIETHRKPHAMPAPANAFQRFFQSFRTTTTNPFPEAELDWNAYTIAAANAKNAYGRA